MEGTITSISPQKKNKNRVAVYLDGSYAFGVTNKTARALSVGQFLAEQDITDLVKNDEIEMAKLKLDHFIGYKERSEQQARKRLQKAGVSEPVITSAVTHFKELGFLNDAAFAKNWITNRSDGKPRGRRLLRLELMQKGIGNELIENALGDAPSEDDLAYAAARAYVHRLEKLDRQIFENRLKGFLQRKGFSFGTTMNTVKKIWLEIHKNMEGSI